MKIKRNVRQFGLALLLVAAFAARGSAQAGHGTDIRDQIVIDSLNPRKMQLRDIVAQLRDTLITVPALQDRIARNMATGVNSVVISNGRELGKRCRIGAAMADLTAKRVAPLYTNNPQGDQALNGYRASLTSLIGDLKVCERDDSLTMVVASPDPKRIAQVAATARDAVARYDAVRDALLKLLGIDLPIKGTIYRGGK
jgi:hypothetical protein